GVAARVPGAAAGHVVDGVRGGWGVPGAALIGPVLLVLEGDVHLVAEPPRLRPRRLDAAAGGAAVGAFHRPVAAVLAEAYRGGRLGTRGVGEQRVHVGIAVEVGYGGRHPLIV